LKVVIEKLEVKDMKMTTFNLMRNLFI